MTSNSPPGAGLEKADLAKIVHDLNGLTGNVMGLATMLGYEELSQDGRQNVDDLNLVARRMRDLLARLGKHYA